MSETARALQVVLGTHVMDEVLEENRQLRGALAECNEVAERLREIYRNVSLRVEWAVPKAPDDPDDYSVDSKGMVSLWSYDLDLSSEEHAGQRILVDFDGDPYPANLIEFLQSEVRVGNFVLARGDAFELSVRIDAIQRDQITGQPWLHLYFDAIFVDPSTGETISFPDMYICYSPNSSTIERYADLTGLHATQILSKFNLQALEAEWDAHPEWDEADPEQGLTKVEDNNPVCITAEALERVFGPSVCLDVSKYDFSFDLIRRKCHFIDN